MMGKPKVIREKQTNYTKTIEICSNVFTIDNSNLTRDKAYKSRGIVLVIWAEGIVGPICLPLDYLLTPTPNS